MNNQSGPVFAVGPTGGAYGPTIDRSQTSVLRRHLVLAQSLRVDNDGPGEYSAI